MSGLSGALIGLLARDLRLAYRRWDEFGQPLLFFVIVATLFPLALSPEPELLRSIGTGVVWVSALLASLLALDTLFRADAEDGSLEQLVLSRQPLAALVLVKTLAHWLVTGLPLILISPVVAYGFFLPTRATGVMMMALALATPTLSLIGAVAAGLTCGLRKGTGILGLLVLPLVMPVLIFGARATDMAVHGEAVTGPLFLLAALLALAATVMPFGAALALKVSLD